MTHAIRLQSGDIQAAGLYLDLHQNGYLVLDYPMRSGVEETVTETITVLVTAASVAAMQSQKQAIGRYLDAANRRNDRDSEQYQSGDRIFVTVLPDGEATEWRSEILAAAMEPDQDALRIWGNIKEIVRITITRRNYWEDMTERYPTIDNYHGVSSLIGGLYPSGMTVDNQQSVTPTLKTNSVRVPAAQVTGDLPAPARVVLKNSTGSAKSYRQFIFWNNAFALPTVYDYAYLLEGEAALAGYSGSAVADSSCEAGSRWDLSFTDSGEIRLTLSGAVTTAFASRPIHVLARFKSFSSNIYAKAEVWAAGGSVALTPWVQERLLSNAALIQDLGTIVASTRASNNDTLQLAIKLRGSGSKSVALDFIHLAGPDGFRLISMPDGSFGSNDSLVDDGIDGQTYLLANGTSRIPAMVPYGSPILLYPNVDQRMSVLWAGTTYDITWSSLLTLSYRPRKRVI